MKGYPYFAFLIVMTMALLFCDFYTKAYFFTSLPCNSCGVPLREITVLQDFSGIDFSITLALNKGVAWGAFANFQYLILAIRIVVIFAMLCYLFFVRHERSKEIPLVLIVTGAIGNVIDFFLYGSVVDFLHFNLWGYHFPIFNVADILITVGVISFFLASFLTKSPKKQC